MTEADLTSAYGHAVRHRVEVLRSDRCGCFHCLSVFETSTIKNWIDTGQTAMCPRCGIDAVIGSEAGLDLTHEFLSAMRARWFKNLKTA
jgi:uncharacterized paraquat-inducible protein A